MSETIIALIESRNRMIIMKAESNLRGNITVVMGLEKDIAETTRLIELAITQEAKP